MFILGDFFVVVTMMIFLTQQSFAAVHLPKDEIQMPLVSFLKLA